MMMMSTTLRVIRGMFMMAVVMVGVIMVIEIMMTKSTLAVFTLDKHCSQVTVWFTMTKLSLQRLLSGDRLVWQGLHW